MQPSSLTIRSTCASSARADRFERTRTTALRKARSNLLSDLLQEGLSAQAVAGFVLDDLLRQASFGFVGAARVVADFAGQASALGRRWPSLLRDRRGLVRAAVMGRLGFRDVMEQAGVGRTLARTVTARTGGGQSKRVADSAVTPADPAILTGQLERSFPERFDWSSRKRSTARERARPDSYSTHN